jgi:hypothetical protein
VRSGPPQDCPWQVTVAPGSFTYLSSSIWLWHRENGRWGIQKAIDIPGKRTDPDQLPPALKDFTAGPPPGQRHQPVALVRGPRCSRFIFGAHSVCSSIRGPPFSVTSLNEGDESAMNFESLSGFDSDADSDQGE